MVININDLNGFDFSEKYLKIKKKFSIDKNGKKVDFNLKINPDYPKRSKHKYILECQYFNKTRFTKRIFEFDNPFKIYNKLEKRINHNEILRHNQNSINDILKEYNPKFDKWDEFYGKFSRKSFNLLDFFPDYEVSFIPKDKLDQDIFMYLNSKPKYDLVCFFEALSILDFEFLRNSMGMLKLKELIKKAYNFQILEEDLFDSNVFNLILAKREMFYYDFVFKEYGFPINDKNLMFYLSSSKDNSEIYYKEIRLYALKKLGQLRFNQRKYEFKSNFNDLNDCLTKSKYIFVLKAISSNSKSAIVKRYKIPNEIIDEDSVHNVALKNNHIKYGNSKEKLSEYTNNNLQNVLKKYNLPVSGRKDELIERINENLTDEIINKEFKNKFFILTEDGERYLKKYYYLSEFYNVVPDNFTLEEFDFICKANEDINPDEIIKCLVNESWLKWDCELYEKPSSITDGENKNKLDEIFKNRESYDYYKTEYDHVILV